MPTTDSNQYVDLLLGMGLMHAPSNSIISSTISASSPEMVRVRSLPSVPEAHQSPPIDENPPVEVAWHSVQGSSKQFLYRCHGKAYSGLDTE